MTDRPAWQNGKPNAFMLHRRLITMGFLSNILPAVRKTVASGYYDVKYDRPKLSLVEAIEEAQDDGIVPLIAEIKLASQKERELVRKEELPALVETYADSDAAGISIVTEPTSFRGSMELLKHDFRKPVLMKDFVISEKQIRNGDAVLLIMEFMELAQADANELIDIAHERDLEVLLEVNSADAFRKAKKTEADIIGINNRNLQTLETNIETTVKILKETKCDRLLLSESGIENAEDIRKLLAAGVDGVLVGTSILKSKDKKGAIGRLALIE